MKQALLLGVMASVILMALACNRAPANQAQINQEIQALNDKEIKVRWKAIGKLSTYQRDAVPALVTALQSDNPDVRWCAAGSLALIGPPGKESLPQLLKVAAGDADVAVKEIAQLAANQVGGDNAAKRPAAVSLITSVPPGGMSVGVPSELLLERLRAEIDQPEKKEN